MRRHVSYPGTVPEYGISHLLSDGGGDLGAEQLNRTLVRHWRTASERRCHKATPANVRLAERNTRPVSMARKTQLSNNSPLTKLAIAPITTLATKSAIMFDRGAVPKRCTRNAITTPAARGTISCTAISSFCLARERTAEW